LLKSQLCWYCMCPLEEILPSSEHSPREQLNIRIVSAEFTWINYKLLYLSCSSCLIIGSIYFFLWLSSCNCSCCWLLNIYLKCFTCAENASQDIRRMIQEFHRLRGCLQIIIDVLSLSSQTKEVFSETFHEFVHVEVVDFFDFTRLREKLHDVQLRFIVETPMVAAKKWIRGK